MHAVHVAVGLSKQGLSCHDGLSGPSHGLGSGVGWSSAALGADEVTGGALESRVVSRIHVEKVAPFT